MTNISKLEIKITKEANGDDVRLDNLSLQASKSLVVLLDAMNKMAEFDIGNNDIRIKVINGSAGVALDADNPVMDNIQSKINSVINRDSDDYLFIENLRNIQNVVKANGLTYEATICNSNSHQLDLIPFLKNSRKISSPRRTRNHSYFDLEFFNGKLIENGGKYPNIHIETNGRKYKIVCTEQQARKVNAFLYQDIKISAWGILNPDNKKEYIFCDHYINDDLYIEFKRVARTILDASGVEPLIKIHDKFKELIIADEYEAARKFMKMFSNEVVDNNKLRAVLLATKSFKEHDSFKDIVIKVMAILKKKTGKEVI